MPLNRKSTTLAGVPAVLLSSGPASRAAARGTVLFFHGLGASKEVHLQDVEPLAERGLLVALVDNVGHGERPPSAEQLELIRRLGWQGAFLEAVRRTAEEVPALLDALTRDCGAMRFGVSGVSMGGYITYGAVLRDRRILAAAPILGSPDWDGLPDSPHRQASLFFPCALLAQNAGRDTTVPARHARTFHAQLVPYYAQAPERLQYVEYPDSAHFMEERDWLAARDRAVAWLDRFLAEGAGG